MKRIRVHTLTDGRDCEDGTSIPLMETLCKDLEALCKQGVDAKVASGGGRMCTTMDRYEVLTPCLGSIIVALCETEARLAPPLALRLVLSVS